MRSGHCPNDALIKDRCGKRKSIGPIFGSALAGYFPGMGADPRAFAMVGMGGFLTAVTHAPSHGDHDAFRDDTQL